MAASCSAGLRGEGKEGKGKIGHCAAVRARGAPRGQSECGTSTAQGCGHSQRPAAPPKPGDFGSASSLCLGQSFTVPSFIFLNLFFCLFIFTPLLYFFSFCLFVSLLSSFLLSFLLPFIFPPPIPGQGGAAQPAVPPGPGRLSAAIAARGGKAPVPLPLSAPTPRCPLAFPLLHLGENRWIAAGSRWSPGVGDYGPRRAPRPFLLGKKRG